MNLAPSSDRAGDVPSDRVSLDPKSNQVISRLRCAARVLVHRHHRGAYRKSILRRAFDCAARALVATRRSGDRVVSRRIVRVERKCERDAELSESFVGLASQRESVRVDLDLRDADVARVLSGLDAVWADQRVATGQLNALEPKSPCVLKDGANLMQTERFVSFGG